MTPATVIAAARILLNDATEPYRQSDDELLTYVNAGMGEAVIINPGLFSTLGTHACTAGTVDQALVPAVSVALIDVLGIHDGVAFTQFDPASLSAFSPGWRNATPGTPAQWAKVAVDLRRFMLDVPPDSAVVLDVRHAKVPAALSLGDTITDLQDIYESALADYVVARAESKDDEHVLSQRAASHYQAFVAKIKG